LKYFLIDFIIFLLIFTNEDFHFIKKVINVGRGKNERKVEKVNIK